MKKIKIDDLLYGSKKNRFTGIKARILLYTIIISIITVFCMYMTLYKDNYTNSYSNSSYDYYIQEINREQVAELAEKDFVEGIFPFSLMMFSLKKNVNSAVNDGASIALFVTSSFDNINYSSFVPESMICEDKSILNDETRNPIIIDYSLSKSEGISLGDTFTLYSERALGGMKKEFTVGAVYQNHSEVAQYDVVIIVNEETNSDMLQLDPEAGYTLAFVKASDVAAFKEYLENDFYPQLGFEKKAEFKSLPLEAQKSYYTSREERMSVAEDDLDFSGTGMIVIAVVAFIALIMLIKREHEKVIENHMYNIAVLYSLGLKKKTLLMRLLINSFIPVSVSIILACIINKFVIFGVITSGIFVSVKTITLYGAACLVIAFVVIFVLTIASTAKKITAERVLDCTNNEKRI